MTTPEIADGRAGTPLRVGEIEIYWLRGGVFELDGGAMFGVVPKVLWSKKYPSTDNYIELTASPMLLRTPQANVLIETGIGNKLSDKQKKIFRVKEEWDVPGSLAALGLSRADIDFVILTHGDWDHAGGVVLLNGDRPELAFPRARHVIQKIEWEDVCNPNIRSGNTYWKQNFEGLSAPWTLWTVDGEAEIALGVTVRRTGGHTKGHQIVKISSGNETALHMADLLPTHAHFNPLWVMAYDNFPMDAIAEKEKLVTEAREANAWFTFYHDPFMRACRFDPEGQVVDKWPA